MPLELKQFQETVRDGIVARWRNVASQYAMAGADFPLWRQIRLNDAAVVLRAPTGSGKTAMAIDALAEFSGEEPVLWFWFAPFAGLVEQARKAIRSQAPALRVLDLSDDRKPELTAAGAVFVTTWAAVAARNADARRARTTGDDGLAVDALVAAARERGLRIGCVVDEAHHGFQRAAQAKTFFRDVLAPDYALLMTATPRDADIEPFQRDTGYNLGDEADWASVARVDAVHAGLLKQGVRVVRFLARDDDTRQLIDFEQLALRECASVHRRIGQMLDEAGVALTPLMLVQVPDGKQAQEAARLYLVETLKFAEDAVRIHTADEPDPDLISLANDPTVEVLIFKMAVALGFDAPRAFTLAALRGARDPSFGVQVIGRIVRVHRLLQGRRDALPDALDYGYVFLANAESQEGLLSAGQQINRLRTQAPEIGTSTVVTYSGSQKSVQLVAAGEPMALIVDSGGDRIVDGSSEGDSPPPTDGIDAAEREAVWRGWQEAAQAALGLGSHPVDPLAAVSGEVRRADSVGTLALNAKPVAHEYRRRAGVPSQLRTERLSEAPADIEIRLVDFVDFSATVLASRDKVRAAVQRRESDIFEEGRVGEGSDDVWADLSAPAIAGKAQQVIQRLADINAREIRLRLLERFAAAIEKSGAIPSSDEELLEQQLDLVLVRNPGLLRDAYRRLRMNEVRDLAAPLPEVLASELPLESSLRNAYGVFPPGLNGDELRIAQELDADPRVLWWHRNASSHHRPDAIGLYRWDEGAGFFPDFVVAVRDRDAEDNVALLEVKGGHLWGEPVEVEKQTASHPVYGPVFMVGRRRGEKGFSFLRTFHGRLQPDGTFDVGRMVWK